MFSVMFSEHGHVMNVTLLLLKSSFSKGMLTSVRRSTDIIVIDVISNVSGPCSKVTWTSVKVKESLCKRNFKTLQDHEL